MPEAVETGVIGNADPNANMDVSAMQHSQDGSTDRITVNPEKGDPGKTQDTKPTKPEGIPDKFWNAETGEVDTVGLAKSYTELEQKLSQKDKPKEGDMKIDPQKAADNMAKDGIDVNAFAEEFATNGELSDGTYQTLEKYGITRDVVDQYIEGQMAIVNATRNEIFSSLGNSPEEGQKAYEEMVGWAKDSFSESEINEYNRMVESGKDAAKLAVAGLKARYQDANGRTPRLVTGENAPYSGEGFESQEQYIAAVRDPLYRKDPAYRAKVERKLMNSHNLLNVNVY
jgi:hypothetical protein